MKDIAGQNNLPVEIGTILTEMIEFQRKAPQPSNSDLRSLLANECYLLKLLSNHLYSAALKSRRPQTLVNLALQFQAELRKSTESAAQIPLSECTCPKCGEKFKI